MDHLERTLKRAANRDRICRPLPAVSSRGASWRDPDLPDRPGPASLIVALRERPTLRHYDPEVVEFWSSRGGRGTHQTITRDSRMPFSTGVSWGEIRILDRLGESNGYLGFGGRCDAELIDGTAIIAFTSSAPILRRGGHSQGWDEGADAVGAFFARLLVTVDYVPGFEEQLANATPLARYAGSSRTPRRATGACRSLLETCGRSRGPCCPKPRICDRTTRRRGAMAPRYSPPSGGHCESRRPPCQTA